MENHKIWRLGIRFSGQGRPLLSVRQQGNSRGRASTSLKHRGHDKAREVGGSSIAPPGARRV